MAPPASPDAPLRSGDGRACGGAAAAGGVSPNAMGKRAVVPSEVLLYIKHLGNTHAIHINYNASVGELKAKVRARARARRRRASPSAAVPHTRAMLPPGQVAEKAKVPPSEQKIVFAGRILSDDAQTLDSDKLQLNKEVTLTLMQKGQRRAASSPNQKAEEDEEEEEEEQDDKEDGGGGGGSGGAYLRIQRSVPSPSVFPRVT